VGGCVGAAGPLVARGARPSADKTLEINVGGALTSAENDRSETEVLAVPVDVWAATGAAIVADDVSVDTGCETDVAAAGVWLSGSSVSGDGSEPTVLPDVSVCEVTTRDLARDRG
jgi:hypothetical protein